MPTLSPAAAAFFAQCPLDVQAFSGQWFICHTSLSFWRGKTHPTITYTASGAYSPARILDEVRYHDAQGRPQAVVGYDRLLDTKGSALEWVAQPWYLRFLRSTWGVVAHDAHYAQWAVTYFSKTLFTAAGMDIYARSLPLENARYREILAQVAAIEFLQPHLTALYATQHS